MIKPYKNPRPVPEVAWLLDAETVLHESGLELNLSDATQQKEIQVWASIDLITRLLSSGTGEALSWDNKPIRWSPVVGANEFPVRVLRLVTPSDADKALHGLMLWRDWLADYGAAPAGSLGGSGMSLLKATLKAPLWTSAGEPPPIHFTLGGRQEVGTYGAPSMFTGRLRHWDMQAAYARTLGNLRYGGWWRRLEGRELINRLSKGTQRMMFVRAKVRIPEQSWADWLGPLPERPRTQPDPLTSFLCPVAYPTGRDMQGVWTAAELRQAEAWGCKTLRVLEAWMHFAKPDSYPFAPWLEAVETGRRMGGFAAVLAKATGNATWGQFAISRQARKTAVHVVHLVNGTRRRIIRTIPNPQGNPSQKAPDLAEYVTGKVRAELYRGMMQADEDLLTAHTDGLWLAGTTYVQGWRSKDEAAVMRLITPQNYAYRRIDDDSDTYVVAGIPVKSAGDFFEDEWERLTEVRPYALRPEDRRSRVSSHSL